MNDLLYSDELSDEIAIELKKIFPEIKIESSYDDIHGERLSVEIPEINRREYLEHLIKNGNGEISFHIQMCINAPKFRLKNEELAENLKEIRGIVEELEKEKLKINPLGEGGKDGMKKRNYESP